MDHAPDPSLSVLLKDGTDRFNTSQITIVRIDDCGFLHLLRGILRQFGLEELRQTLDGSGVRVMIVVY